MAKYYSFITVLFCVFTLRVEAQNIIFNKAYDDYGAWESAVQASETSDSTILLAAQTEDNFASDSTQIRRLYFSLLDNNGTQIKKNILSLSNQKFQYTLKIQKRGAEYFTVASFSDLDSTVEHGHNYAKCISLKPNGDPIRTIHLKYHYFPNGKPGFSVPRPISDGNFINIASYNSTYGDSLYLVWNDSMGNIIRVKEYPKLHTLISSIIETPDHGFLLSGFEYQDERYKTNPDFEVVFVGHPERLWYAKIDSVGNLLWQKLLTGNGYELYDTIYFKYKVCNQTRFQDAVKMQDGSYVLAGFIENNAYLTKINENGEKIWEYKYFTKLNYIDSFRRRAIIIDIQEQKNNLLVLGVIDSLKEKAQSTTKFTFLMKLSSTGKVLWVRYFETGNTSIIYDVFSLREGILLTGSILDTVPKYGGQDVWLIRLDSNGCLIPGCYLDDVIDTTLASLPFLSQKNAEIVIYPNPADDNINIMSELMDFTISIYDLLGRKVYFNNSCSGKETHMIQSNGFHEGIYTIQIEDNKSARKQNWRILIRH